MGTYRCQARNLDAFVQQVAVGLVCRGYRYFVPGFIPRRVPDARRVDRVLVEKYEIGLSRAEYARRDRRAQRDFGRRYSRIQYLRCRCRQCRGRFFVLMATPGEHESFFVEEAERVRDITESALVHGGYRIELKNGHASVKMEREEIRRLKRRLMKLALGPVEMLEEELRRVRFQPYAPVVLQLRQVRAEINSVRRRAGIARDGLIAVEVIPERRTRNMRVFVEDLAA